MSDAPAIDASTCFVRAPTALAKELDGEVLVVPLQEQMIDLDDAFYNLRDPSALRVWELLERPLTLAGLVEDLLSRFDAPEAQVRADLVAFLGDLERIGAIQRVG